MTDTERIDLLETRLRALFVIVEAQEQALEFIMYQMTGDESFLGFDLSEAEEAALLAELPGLSLSAEDIGLLEASPGILANGPEASSKDAGGPAADIMEAFNDFKI